MSGHWKLLTNYRNDTSLEVSHYDSWMQLMPNLIATQMKCIEHVVVCVRRFVLEQSDTV